jgi:caa(3)-type oxidase subunit IV
MRRAWRRNGLALFAVLGLVAATFGLAYVPLGRFNLVLALAIAAAKAMIIGLVFMELRLAKAFIRLAAATPFLWIIVMFVLTFCDLAFRLR